MPRPLPTSWRRPTRAARPTSSRTSPPLLLALVTALAGHGCGKAPAAPVAVEPEPPPRTELLASDLAGTWKWSLVSEESGIRRIELETWRLASTGEGDPDALTGSCERSVTFLSLDGTPFSCNQSLHYQLRATYRIEGRVADQAIDLVERDFHVAASPCEPGDRGLARYRGSLRDALTMHLTWDGGEQTLARVAQAKGGRATTDAHADRHDQTGTEARAPADPSASPSADALPTPLTGSWRWHSRNRDADEVRVEVEDWRLDEAADSGVLSGTVVRTVTVFTESGSRYACSGDTFYRYRDRYRLRGQRQGDQVTLTEVAVEPEKHACLEYPERHLDAARGQVSGPHLVLTWRGGKRQVLRRPH